MPDNTDKAAKALNKARTAKARLAQKRKRDARTAQAEADKRAILRERAVELRMDGLDWRTIGKHLGCSHGMASTLFDEALAERQEKNNVRARKAKNRLIYNLGRVEEQLYEIATNRNLEIIEEKADKNGEVQVMKLEEFEKVTKTADSLVKVHKRLADLMGLDEAKKVEFKDSDGAVGGFTARHLAAVAEAARAKFRKTATP